MRELRFLYGPTFDLNKFHKSRGAATSAFLLATIPLVNILWLTGPATVFLFVIVFIVLACACVRASRRVHIFARFFFFNFLVWAYFTISNSYVFFIQTNRHESHSLVGMSYFPVSFSIKVVASRDYFNQRALYSPFVFSCTTTTGEASEWPARDLKNVKAVTLWWWAQRVFVATTSA